MKHSRSNIIAFMSLSDHIAARRLNHNGNNMKMTAHNNEDGPTFG